MNYAVQAHRAHFLLSISSTKFSSHHQRDTKTNDDVRENVIASAKVLLLFNRKFSYMRHTHPHGWDSDQGKVTIRVVPVLFDV